MHRTAEHLGRLLRTVFLCDYLAVADFRREVHTLLSRGESVHQLQRAAYIGRIASVSGGLKVRDSGGDGALFGGHGRT